MDARYLPPAQARLSTAAGPCNVPTTLRRPRSHADALGYHEYRPRACQAQYNDRGAWARSLDRGSARQTAREGRGLGRPEAPAFTRRLLLDRPVGELVQPARQDVDALVENRDVTGRRGARHDGPDPVQLDGPASGRVHLRRTVPMVRPCRRGQAGVTSGPLALFPGAVNVSYITPQGDITRIFLYVQIWRSSRRCIPRTRCSTISREDNVRGVENGLRDIRATA